MNWPRRPGDPATFLDALPSVITPQREATPGYCPRVRIFIHNDNATPMDFVVYVLVTIFKKSVDEAANIMLEAHRSGAALVDVLPLELAELRVDQAHSLARTQHYPLKFTLEKE